MAKKWKTLATLLLSALALVLALNALSTIFIPKLDRNLSTTEMWSGFYSEPRDTIDVLYVGDSKMYHGLMPTEIYREHGVTGYNLSVSRMRHNIAELYLREALRYQKPKLLVLSNQLFAPYDFDYFEASYRIALDPMRMSWDKLKTAYGIIEDSSKQTFTSYLFPLMRYHDRWTGIKPNDIAYLLHPPRCPEKGWFSIGNFNAYTLDASKLPTDEIDAGFVPRAVTELQCIADLCKENGVQLLMIQLPVMGSEYTYAMLNGSQQLFDEMGIDNLDMNSPELLMEIGLDLSVDFSSQSHLNAYGAAKVTDYVGDYIAAHYDLPDRRGQDGAAQWDADVLDARATWLELLASKNLKPPIRVEANDDSVRLAWSDLRYYDSVRIQRRFIGSDTVDTLADGERIADYTDTGVTAPCEYTVTFTIEGREDRAVTFTVAYEGASGAKERAYA